MKDNFHYHKKLIVLGGVLGLLSVLFGAYGSHTLASQVDAATFNAFDTAVRYQIYHAILAVVVGGFGFLSKRTATLIFAFILLGVVCFSGSIYGLATAHITNFHYARFAYITPLGGLFFMAAWVTLIVQTIRIKLT